MFHQLKYVEPFREIFWQYSNRVQVTRLRRLFEPKVSFEFERGGFVIRTIQNRDELEGVMRLRYDVFHREYRHRHFPLGVDVEPFDLLADHLVIFDRSTSRPVGTYRLICSNQNSQFYSGAEFHIDGFLETSGTKLELSRACIRRGYRKGIVMGLLWRGLVEYIRRVDARYLFGCSSVKTTDPAKIQTVIDHLKERNALTEEWRISPKPGFIPPGLCPSSHLPQTLPGDLLPPLLQSYLKAGARVAPEPALDKDYNCFDFFTVLDIEKLTSSFEKRYAL